VSMHVHIETDDRVGDSVNPRPYPDIPAQICAYGIRPVANDIERADRQRSGKKRESRVSSREAQRFNRGPVL
jgi:hypothetical protein